MKKKLVTTLLTVSSTLLLQAGEQYGIDNAKLTGARIAKAEKGFTGKGYVDYVKKRNESIKWTVTAEAGGKHYLSFRYALEKGNRPLQLKINGITVIKEVPFQATGGWKKWGWTTIRTSLREGVNNVSLASIGESGANVDCLYVNQGKLTIPQLDIAIGQKSSASPSEVKAVTSAQSPTLFQAETAKHKGVRIAKNMKGYTGKGFVDYVKKSNESITWTIKRKSEGECHLAFRYALGSKNSRPLKLEVNGKVVDESLSFENSGAWTAWTWTKATANLNPGENTVVLTSIGKSGANIDCMAIVSEDMTKEELDNIIK